MGISTDHSKPTQAIIVDYALQFFFGGKGYNLF